MKPKPRSLVIIALAVSLLVGVASFARELGAREARERIAQALGLDKPDNVHIKNISRGAGGEAIVEAQFDAAFRFAADKTGKWKAIEVRTGDRKWESIELIHTAIRKEKALRTAADLRTLATALEAYRRDNGSYVVADNCSVLIDHLSPRYLNSIIRLDAWSHEFDYKGAATNYRLASVGPDGQSGTDDDIVLENGQSVKGAVE
jgi:Type II secretion system (T2SS), protein G